MRPAPAVLRSDNLIDAYELDADLDAMSGTTAEEEYTDALRAEIAYRPERDGTLVIETDAAGTHGPSMGPSPVARRRRGGVARRRRRQPSGTVRADAPSGGVHDARSVRKNRWLSAALPASSPAEINYHDWSDAPFRLDRAGHQRDHDGNRATPPVAHRVRDGQSPYQRDVDGRTGARSRRPQLRRLRVRRVVRRGHPDVGPGISRLACG